MVSGTGCSLNIVFFFSRNFNTLRPLPRHHLAAFGWTENGQLIRETVHCTLRRVALLKEGDGLQ